MRLAAMVTLTSYDLNLEQTIKNSERVVLLVMIYFSGDKLVRATELVKLLTLEKSMQGAIKLVTKLKLPNLAERFNSILEVILLTFCSSLVGLQLFLHLKCGC